MSKQKYPQSSVTSADGTKAAHKGREFYSHDKADARKDKRRQDAEARQREYDGLSATAKIARAKSRRGESKREVARILAKLAKQPEYPKVQVAPSPTPLVDAYKAEKSKTKRTPKSKVVRAAKTENPSKS